MRLNSRILLGVVAVLMSLLVLSACAAPTAPVEKEKVIKVGVGVAFTGPESPTGEPWSRCYRDYLIYLDEVLGGIEYKTPEGKTERVGIKVIWEDTAHNIPKVISTYKRMRTEGIKLFCNVGSSLNDAIMPLCTADKIPVVCAGHYCLC